MMSANTRPRSCGEQIGFVPQETFLFSLTLGENIALGVKDATEEQIRRAAEIAGLATDLESFPEGSEDDGRRARASRCRAGRSSERRSPAPCCAIRASDSGRRAVERRYADGRANPHAVCRK